MTRQVALIGFGEAGQTFASAGGWRDSAGAYDRLTDDPATRAAKEDDYRRLGVAGFSTSVACLAGAEIALSLVTADQALVAAKEAASSLGNNALFCDMNSVAPSTKRAGAEAVDRAGARYVDVAIMAPVNPARLDVPLLVSGTAADDAAAHLGGLGFTNVRAVGDRIGQASAIKMIRSVLVKGIEGLVAECLLAADAAGVTEEVLASLDASERAGSWADRADYVLGRMIQHGLRRSEEMAESVRTLEDLGIEPVMTRGTVVRQRSIGELALGKPPEGLAAKVHAITDKRRHAA